MSLVPSALTPRKAIVGLVIILSVCIGISVAIDTDKPKASAVLDTVASSVMPSPVPSPNATPGNPSQTPSPVPLPTGTIPPGNRDLSQYENGGTLTIGVGASGTVRDAILNQTRSFLWRKWAARGNGRLVLVSANLAGRLETRNFYIEQDTAGAWKITVEMPNSDPEDFYFVEEIGVAGDGSPILETRPGGPPAASRALHLKHRSSARNGLIF